MNQHINVAFRNVIFLSRKNNHSILKCHRNCFSAIFLQREQQQQHVVTKRKFVSSNATEEQLSVVVHANANNGSEVTVYNGLSGKNNNNKPSTYIHGWAWQKVLLQERLRHHRNLSKQSLNTCDIDTMNRAEEQDKDYLLFFEHEPVYTLGRGSDERNLTFSRNDSDVIRRLSRKSKGNESARLYIKNVEDIVGGESIDIHEKVQSLVDSISHYVKPVIAPNDAPVYRVERGGEVTFHGPGQLVVYPLLNLRHKPYKQDLHWYLRMVEEIIIQTLRVYDIEGIRDEINTGVWVEDKKIAAVGVSASNWITTHGFAINVNPDLSFFDTSVIIPCGIESRSVTSIAQILSEKGGNKHPSLHDLAHTVTTIFEQVFGVQIGEERQIK